MGVFLVFLSIGLLATTVLILIGVVDYDKVYEERKKEPKEKTDDTQNYYIPRSPSSRWYHPYGNNHTERRVKSKFWKFWYDRMDGALQYISIGILVICIIALIFISVFSIVTVTRRNIEYQRREYQYIMLSKKIESDSNNYFLFYDDIKEYNNAILEDRYWSNNKWVNWYHNGKIKDLPLIGVPSEKPTSVLQQFDDSQNPTAVFAYCST